MTTRRWFKRYSKSDVYADLIAGRVVKACYFNKAMIRASQMANGVQSGEYLKIGKIHQQGEIMLEIRWHSRAGQGAVTGAKGLAEVVATTGKDVQAFAFYGSAKRGAAMTAYNRVDDKVILNHEKFMKPDYVLVIDPALVYAADITENEKENTVYIVTTHLSTQELVDSQPKLSGKKVFTVDCIKISQETIGKAIPNTPMLGALMKISGMYDIEFFKESMAKVLKKLPQKIVDANMIAIQRAYDEVK